MRYLRLHRSLQMRVVKPDHRKLVVIVSASAKGFTELRIFEAQEVRLLLIWFLVVAADQSEREYWG